MTPDDPSQTTPAPDAPQSPSVKAALDALSADTAAPGGTAEATPDGKARRPRKKRASKAKEMAAALTGVAALTGAVLPDEERMAPRINVQVPITALARALAQHLRNEPFFRRASSGQLVTVDENGVVEPMTAVRFPSYAGERVTFMKETRGGEVVVDLGTEASNRILAADCFLRLIRPLKSVHLVRLPTWANPERTAAKLMPVGYDESTQAYTVDTVPYDENMMVDDGRRIFLDAFKEFPFGKPDNEPEQPLEKNRSFAVQVAAMLGVYCRPLLTGTLRPAIAVQANQPSSGKTLLVRAALAPVYGAVTVQSAPRDETELGKVLTATAAEGYDYLVMDNLHGYFASAELEAFLTSPRRRGRILGVSQMVDAENVLSLFITGNTMTISPDLARRCLLIDLWFAGEVKERRIARPMEDEQLSSQQSRASFLAALWSLVSHWSFNNCVRSPGARLASFETFSAIIGGIVTAAMFVDPIAQPEVRLDEKQMAWQALFKALASEVADGEEQEFNLEEVMATANAADLMETLTGNAKNPKISLGMSLKTFRGREFTDAAGRRFTFGHRKAEVGARYKVKILTPAKPALNEEDPL